MKKLCLLIPLICLLSVDAVQAQLEQGNVMVGVASTLNLDIGGSDFMSIGFSSTKYKSGNYTSDPIKSACFNFMPKAGYFIMDNLAAGINLYVSTSSEKDTDGDKDTETMLGIGPWARYYYPLDNIYPFVEVSVGVGSTKYAYDYGNGQQEEKYSAFLAGAGVGAAIPVGDNVTFDIMAGYMSVTAKEKDGGSESDYKEITGTFGITMGFMVYFGL
jgi:outer membrane protein